MTKAQNLVELEKTKKLIDATLNFLLLYNTGKLICDNVDSDEQHYKNQQTQANKYFRSEKLDKLKSQLYTLINTLKYMGKLKVDFNTFIKQHTGYELDIYEEHRKNFEAIIAKGRIDTKKECNDLCIMVAQQRIDDKEMEELYGPLLEDFSRRQQETIESSPELKKKYDAHHEIIEEDGELIEIFYSHGKPSHHKRREELSPDGKAKLSITESAFDGHSSTSIQLNFENYGFGLYSTNGIYPEINAIWKDSRKIIIETKGQSSTNKKHKKIEICGHTFTIEYLET